MAFDQHLLALRGWARGGPQKLFFIFLRFRRDAEAQSFRGAVNGARGTRSGGGVNEEVLGLWDLDPEGREGLWPAAPGRLPPGFGEDGALMLAASFRRCP